ncbi:hypothetical protein OG350_37980 [Streptomyces achromogenes]|uniref:Uncharacterized protein n=1 Tax=Streptomyces achromogenes TaxID=67255 RepID=A0ABZ1KJ31_STRAH
MTNAVVKQPRIPYPPSRARVSQSPGPVTTNGRTMTGRRVQSCDQLVAYGGGRSEHPHPPFTAAGQGPASNAAPSKMTISGMNRVRPAEQRDRAAYNP